LLATGSHSFLPPVPGNDRDGVFTLRNIADARRIRAFCREGQRAVLIGGGLLGLETGQALLKRGLKVTVAEMFPRLLPRQLDDKGAARLQGLLAERGFDFRLGVTVQEITGGTGAGQVLLAAGVSLPAGLVIFSAGVRPNLELARSLGLDCDKGVIVDNAMRTSRPEVFAAGDVAEFNGVSYGLWPAALQQGRAAGAAMAGEEPGYRGTAPAARLKVAGIDLAAAGEIDADHKYQAVVEESATVYRKFVTEQGRLIGFIMLGDTSDFTAMSKALAEGARYPG
jgi:nitrite reductase (NADH) large subunit